MHLNHPPKPSPSHHGKLSSTKLVPWGPRAICGHSLEQPDGSSYTVNRRVTHTPQHPFLTLQMISPVIRINPQLSTVAPASLCGSPSHSSPQLQAFFCPCLLNMLRSKAPHMLLPLSGKLALGLWFPGVSSTLHFSVSRSSSREDFPVQATSNSTTVDRGGRTGVEGRREKAREDGQCKPEKLAPKC